MLKRKHNLISTIGVALVCLGLVVVLATCADDGGGSDDGGSGSTAKYTCENGAVASGTPDGDADEVKCDSCNDFFKLNGDNDCVATVYTCTGGAAANGSPNATDDAGVVDTDAANADIEKCASCNTGYRLDTDNELCELNRYICTNGTAVVSTDSDKPDTDETVQKCSGCASGYELIDNTCMVEGTTTYGYVCENGTKADGKSATENTTKCTECDEGFALDSNEACVTEQSYVCANGTPADGGSAVANTNNCKDCDDGYRLDGVTCVLNRYTCTNGEPAVATDMNKPATDEMVELCAACDTGYRLDNGICALNRYVCSNGQAVTSTDSDKPDTDMEEKCDACDFGYDKENDVCSLSTVGQWRFDTNPACSTSAACVATMDANGNLSWVGSCDNHAPLSTYTNYTLADGTITYTNGPNSLDYTIDAADGHFVLNPHSTALGGDRFMCPFFGAVVTQPTVVGAVASDGATFSTSVSHAGTLFWAVYADDTPVQDGATLIVNVAIGSTDIVQRSDAAGIAVTAGTTTTFTVSGLSVTTDYDLYVALQADVDGITQRVLSDKYDLTTAAVACGTGQHAQGESCVNNSYICPNGEAVVSTDTDRPDTHNTVEACVSCTAPYHLSSARECSFMVVEHVDGSDNVVGRTITCRAEDGAAVGDTATIDFDGDGGVYGSLEYTKRTAAEIKADTSLAATSCTSDIKDMSRLFADTATNDNDSFNKDITHWDTSSVTNMRSMFHDEDYVMTDVPQFDQDIGYWDVSGVTDMSDMFNGAASFNRNIGNWDVSKVRHFTAIFAFASKFNNGGSDSIGSWDISSNHGFNSLAQMFQQAVGFTQDISQWCTIDSTDGSTIGTPDTTFNEGVTGWSTEHQPQWNTSAGNNCPVNFTSQPIFVSADSTVTLTASKESTLYWILFDTDTMFGTVADLTGAINNEAGVARSADNLTAGDDTEVSISLSGANLTSGTTYYFYAALESEGESALSDRVVITP